MKTYERIDLIIQFLDWYRQLPDKEAAPGPHMFETANNHFAILQDELRDIEKFLDE